MWISLQSPQLVLGSFTALAAATNLPGLRHFLCKPVQISCEYRVLHSDGLWEREPGGLVLQSINTSLPCVIYKSQCDIAISLQNTYCLCKSTPSCVHFYLIYSKRSCILACPSSNVSPYKSLLEFLNFDIDTVGFQSWGTLIVLVVPHHRLFLQNSSEYFKLQSSLWCPTTVPSNHVMLVSYENEGIITIFSTFVQNTRENKHLL